MALAEKVTGAMSTYTISGNVTVGGTKYDANKASVLTVKDTVAAVDKGDDVTIYLDANGYGRYCCCSDSDHQSYCYSCC